MRILGIETSCDETAVALVEDGKILSEVVASQVALHEQYSGVVPELASRAHLENLPWVMEETLRKAALKSKVRGVVTPEQVWASARGLVDAVAYTRGPGLAGALLIGKVAAQALAFGWDRPLLGIHHLEGHIFAAELEGIR